MSNDKAGCAFPLVDQYMSIRLGGDLSELPPGQVTVVESSRRVQREESYGFILALWWVWLADGRSLASAPLGAGPELAEILAAARGREALDNAMLVEQLKGPVNRALRQARLKEINRTFRDLLFACNASLLQQRIHGDCRRLTDDSVPPAEEVRLPTHCFPDGIVYGVVADGRVVSYAYAHRAGVMEDRVADLGVFTAPPYRRRGCAAACVSAVVAEIARNGGEAYYTCRPDNHASTATARSVGFVPYGASLIFSAPAQ